MKVNVSGVSSGVMRSEPVGNIERLSEGWIGKV